MYIRRLKARVTRCRSLVLDKQKLFSIVFWIGRDCKMTAVKQAACSKAAVRLHQTTCRSNGFWTTVWRMWWRQTSGDWPQVLCVPATATSGRQCLRPTATGTHWVHAPGQRCMAVNGPATRNHLPPALRSPDLSESAFKQALKTHLFSTARRHWDVFVILAPDINSQTYVLTYSSTCQSGHVDCGDI